MNSSEEKLKHIALQLSHPTGEAGLEMGIMMNEANIGMTLEAIKALQLSPGNRVLELGHGNAGHLAQLLQQADILEYTGLEISTTMHEEARRINQEFVVKNSAAFHLYDGENIPFADDYFDRIFTVNTLYFWQNPLAFLNEIYRVLKKNGWAVIAFAHQEYMQTLPFTQYVFKLYSREDFKKLASESAFLEMEIQDHRDSVRTKTGEETIRTYSVARLKK